MARCKGGVCALPRNRGNAPAAPALTQVGGKKDRLGKLAEFPLYNPQQQQIMKQLGTLLQGQLGQAGGPLSLQGLDQLFNPIEQQARTQFNTQTIPTLAERFTAMGGQGGQRSSAFQSALGRAGSDLEQGLAALKAQYAMPYQGQQLQLLQALMGGALQRPNENVYFPKQPSAWGSFFGNLVGGAARGASSLAPLLLRGGM